MKMEEKTPSTEQISGEDRKETEAARTLPPPDFSTFVLSLSTSVLMHLGEIKNPQTGRVEKDLAMARHTIDILAILKEKTRGNLTKDEQALLDGILYDLRMKYCKAVEK